MAQASISQSSWSLFMQFIVSFENLPIINFKFYWHERLSNLIETNKASVFQEYLQFKKK